MGLGGGFGRWIGSTLLFFGMLAFISLYAINASGLLSAAYTNTAINEVVSASTGLNNVNVTTGKISNQSASQIEAVINKTLANNPNCSILCLPFAQQGTSGLGRFLSTSDIQLYQWFALLIAIIGGIMVAIFYEGAGKAIAIGRGLLSAAIISFVVLYIPLNYIIPDFLHLTISNITIVIPQSVFQPYTSVILFLDFIIGGIGAVVLATGVFANKPRAKLPPPIAPMQPS